MGTVSKQEPKEDAMLCGRRNLELAEEGAPLPIPWQPRPSRSMRIGPPGEFGAAELLKACRLLACRGSGPQAWTLSYRHDPIAVLLDTIEEAVSLWGAEGERLYQNRAAEALNLEWRGCAALEYLRQGDRDLERRSVSFTYGSRSYVLEIIRAIHPSE